MIAWAQRLWSSLRGHASPVRSTSARPIKARYDNAQSTDENSRQWWMADYLSAKSANNFQVRRQLRLRSRYEVSNNPYLFGIANGNADDLIGTGPTLQILTSDAAFNRRVEAAWKEWSEAVDLVEKLRTVKLARTVDGEGFLVLKTVPDLDHPVKLYPCDVEADQVTTPAPRDLGELWVDGLVLHPVTGRPVAYTVLKHHPGDYYFPDMRPLAVDRIAASHVVHWFPKFRPGQVRGVPVFTPALDLFSELRSYRKAVLHKVQVAANVTAVVETQAPADVSGVDAGTVTANTATEPFDTLSIDRGMMTTLPWGAKLSQFAAPPDANTYEMFQEKALGEAIRPLNYPLNLALGTSQKFNFSSAKLDHINYREGLKVERSQCETIVLHRIFAAWWAEAALCGILPAGAKLEQTPHEWHWPGFPTLDASVDTSADIAQINAGTLTWREFWATRGYDWRDVMKQQAEEKAEIEALGLSFGEPMKKSEQVDGDPPAGEPASEPADAKAAAKPAARAGWNEGDHPRDESGRFGEGGGGSDGKADDKGKADESDEDVEERRDTEDAEREDSRDTEDVERDSRREKEDADLADAREKQDAEVQAKRDAEDADHDALIADRDKEDEEIAARRQAEDEAREKEDADLAERRDAEDADVEARHEKGEITDAQRDAEHAANDRTRAKEDAALERAREKEDAAREKEDAALEKARAKEDAAREKVEAAREKEDAATEKAREKEDKELERARAREDRETEAKRKAEDREVKDRRKAEDAERKGAK